MTREEAIRIIETVFQDEYVYKYYDSITHQALDMAIEALSEETSTIQEKHQLSEETPTNTPTDLISRQDATSIPILPKEHRKVFSSEDDAFETGWNEALACVNMLPSAEPKTGKWIDEDGTYYANCSKCGYQMDTHQERGYFRYCPNCGSDNRERSEGE